MIIQISYTQNFKSLCYLGQSTNFQKSIEDIYIKKNLPKNLRNAIIRSILEIKKKQKQKSAF